MMLLLDNTVLSNFALVNCVNLLTEALGNQIATTFQVIEEFENGVVKGILPKTDWNWIEVTNLDTQERTLFQELLRRVNAGEAACLAVAVQRNGRFLTDDRDARKLAAQLKIPVSGTLGVLLRLVQINILSMPEANSLLQQMIANGYRSSVQDLSDL